MDDALVAESPSGAPGESPRIALKLDEEQVRPRRSGSLSSFKASSRALSMDAPIPNRVSRLETGSTHLLADLSFFKFYCERARSAYDKAAARTELGGAAHDIEEFDLLRRPGEHNFEAEYRQQACHGSVVSSVDEVMEAARRICPVFRASMSGVLNTIGSDTSTVSVRINSMPSVCDTADRLYTTRSPGPALAWVHDVVAGTVWLESERKICEFVEILKLMAAKESSTLSIASLCNRFKHPTPTHFRDILLLVRVQYAKSPSTWAFMCELQLTLGALHDLNVRLHCDGFFTMYRPFLEDDLAGPLAKKRALVDMVVAEAHNNKKNAHLSLHQRFVDVIENIRAGNDTLLIAGVCALLESAGDYEASLPLRERFVALVRGQSERTCSQDALAHGMHLLGLALCKTRRFHRAARVLKGAVERYNAHGTAALETSVVSAAWGMALACAGQHSKAYEILDTAQGTLLKRNALFGQVLHNMALIRSVEGSYDKAIELYKRAAKVRADALGKESAAIGCTLFNLANALALAGQPSDAAIKYEEAMQCLLKTFGEHHEHYYDCAHNYAKLLVDLDHLRKACQVYEAAFPRSGFFNDDVNTFPVAVAEHSETDDSASSTSSEEQYENNNSNAMSQPKQHPADFVPTSTEKSDNERSVEDVYANVAAAREADQQAAIANFLRDEMVRPDIPSLWSTRHTSALNMNQSAPVGAAAPRFPRQSTPSTCYVPDPEQLLLAKVDKNDDRTRRHLDNSHRTSRLLVRKKALATVFDNAQIDANRGSEIAEGAVSVCTALAMPDMGNVGAFPKGSFLMHHGTYIGVVEDILGSGQFGVVHRLFDVAHHQRVAMKSLATGDDPYVIERLHCILCEEAAASFAIGAHPNVVSMRRVLVPTPGSMSNFPHLLIFSDLVDGKTLGDWMGITHYVRNGSDVPHPSSSAFPIVPDRLFEGQLYKVVSGHASPVEVVSSRDDATTKKHKCKAPANASVAKERSVQQFAVVERRLTALAAQLYLAIHHMHTRGVLHQDIKPDNCMVTPHWWLRVTDFGLAGHSHTGAYPNPDDVDGKLCAELKGGSPAYMSPEALGMMMSSTKRRNTIGVSSRLSEPPTDDEDVHLALLAKRDLDAVPKAAKRFRHVTPATSDLWAAAVVVFEMFARRSFTRRRQSAPHRKKSAALIEFERYAESPNASTWTAADVREWLRSPHHSRLVSDDVVAETFNTTTGAQLALMSEKHIEKVLSKGCESAQSRQLLLRLRATELHWYTMPARLHSVVQHSLATEPFDRLKTSAAVLEALGCQTVFGELRSMASMVGYDAIPDEAKGAVVAHTSDDVRGTLGSIGALFELHERWESALEAYAEWLGDASSVNASVQQHQDARRDALDRYCTVLRKAPDGSIRCLDFSRRVKEHWWPLDDTCFDQICSAAASSHEAGLEIADFYGQQSIQCSLVPLAGMLSLRVLVLTFCRSLSGDLSPLLSLTKLERLELYACSSLEGSLEPLSALVHMVHLVVAHCPRISGTLSPLTKMAKLAHLNLHSNNRMQLTGTLEPLAGASRLTTLKLTECRKLRGRLEPLMGLTNLTKLDISGTEFVESQLPDVVSDLSRLKVLDIAGCDQGLVAELRFARATPRLEVLDAAKCAALKGNLSELLHCAGLTYLNLKHCSECVGGLNDLAPLTSLEYLDIDSCIGIQGTLEPISRLRKLQTLNLSGSRCTGTLAPLETLARLKHIDLVLCESLSGSLKPLESCIQLETIVVKCHDPLTQFEGTLQPLASLLRLRRLQLNGCKKITGTLDPIANLTNLSSLDLEHCTSISGTLAGLATCASLKELDLAYCQALTGTLEPLRCLINLPLIEINVYMCRKLSNVEEFNQYKRANPEHSVKDYLKNRKKKSEAQTAKAKKFLGYGGNNFRRS